MEDNRTLSGRYRLERRLAAGGMGEVWLAADTSLNRQVAVKVLRVGAEADDAAVQRFRREARTTAALQHPHIVSILDAGSHEGAAFIVMELLPGPTLAQLVTERGPLPEEEVVGLAAQIAAGLGAAHTAGVIHRDLKPGNVMFGSSGSLKILDFGIARLAQATTSRLTTTNAVIGTAAYLSPEQATGAPTDARSDLYSLGCILTTMLTGSPPFAGEHPVAVLHQHVHEDPPPLRQRQPAVSPALESLVQRLLEKDPALRPPSADVVERELAAIAGGGEPVAGTTRPLAVTGAIATTVAMPQTGRLRPSLVPGRAAAPEPPARRTAAATPGRRRTWAIPLAALVAVVALTGGILTPLLTSHDETTPAPTPTRTATPSPSPGPTTPTPTNTPSQLRTAGPAPRTAHPRPKKPQKPPKKHHGRHAGK